MFDRLKWAREEHGDFFLVALLFVSFRLFSLLLFRPGGFIIGWSGYYIPEQGFIQLSDRGLYPFIHYWMEYPPLYPWLAVLAYRLSLLIPPWVDARLWFNLIFGTILLLFEVGNFILIYAWAHKLYGPRQAIRCACFYALLFVPLFTLMGWFDCFSLFFLLLGLHLVINGRPAVSGLATGVGFMIKPFPLLVAPLALRALPKISQKVIYVGIACLVALLIATPFLLSNAPFLVASFVNMVSRSPWESVWALMEGFYGGGATVPLSERFDPQMARVAEYPSTLPWLWITLAFALIYLFIYTRPIEWKDDRKAIAFTAFTLIFFFLYSKGWSPQFLIYVLPFVVLLLPNLRGVIYALLLTITNFLEFPVALVMLSQERWLLATAIIFRTALLALLCLECGLILWPSVAIQKVRRGAFVTLLTLALLGGPVVGLGALQAYRGQALNREPYAEPITFLRSEPRAAVLFFDRSLYTRFYPFLGRKSLYLLEERQLWERLEKITHAHSFIWVVATGGNEPEREAERWLSQNTFPVMVKWFENARLSSYSSGVLRPIRSVEVDFAGQILLKGYVFDLKESRTERVLHLRLLWQAISKPEEDYTIFVHLVDLQDRIWAQRDSQPLNGLRPASSWSEGETIEENHGIRLPPEMPPGEYYLLVGLYRPASGERLSILGSEKTSALLEPVAIVKGEGP